jgi:hypothetical protein
MYIVTPFTKKYSSVYNWQGITSKMGGFSIAINSVQAANELAINDSIPLYWCQPRTGNIVQLLAAI